MPFATLLIQVHSATLQVCVAKPRMAKQAIQALGWIVAMFVMTSQVGARFPQRTRQEVDHLKSFQLENGKQMILYKQQLTTNSIF